MSRYGRRRRRSSYGRSQSTNWKSYLVVVAVMGFFGWAVWKFIAVLFANVSSESATAELQILKGQAEFLLSESDEWSRAFPDQQFLAGDSIRTSTNARISFDLFGKSTLFLDGDSELKFIELEQRSSGAKIVKLELKSGQLWSKVSDDDFAAETSSEFTVRSPRMEVFVRGTIFNLATSNTQDSVRLIKGNVDADVFGEGEAEPTNVRVGVGQKLVISPANIETIRAGNDVLEIIDSDFIESEWHLKNLEKFFPQEAAQIRRKIELSQPPQTSTPTPETETEAKLEEPKILSPKEGATIPASQDSIKLEGTAPEGTFQVQVNGYTLSKFQPGDRKWTYFAANKFGTLKPGENTFEVVAIARNGDSSPAAKLNLTYEGNANNPEEETSAESTENSDQSAAPSERSLAASTLGTTPPTNFEFKAPRVTKPDIFGLGESIYQTSAPVVTIRGLVDPKTNAVEVNEFRLKKFQPGDSGFSYTANAGYENMKPGENTYEIVAFGPNGVKAKKIITIVYTPIDIGE